jgi:hypothetical protein
MDRPDIEEIWDNEELLNDVLQSALDLLDD